jgi:rhodanese-related sulfurtransferase
MTRSSRQYRQAFASACRQAFFITLAAAALGLLVNALRPQGLDLVTTGDTPTAAGTANQQSGPPTVELATAREAWENGSAIFIDARTTLDYAAGHIANARNLQENNLDVWMPDFFNAVPPDTDLIVYCSGPRCHLAESLAAKLYEFGYTKTRILTAGWPAWQAAGYPSNQNADE